MSERNGSVTTVNPGTMPIVVGEGATAAPSPAGATGPSSAATAAEPVAGAQPTAPVTVRPTPRRPRRGPLTLLGPWAPAAGGVLGLLAGVVMVLVLAGSAETFEHRFGLALAVVGLGLLGVSGTLLADEVRLVRHGAREALARPGRSEPTAGLLPGMTPARLMVLVSAFVLFLAAYVSRG